MSLALQPSDLRRLCPLAVLPRQVPLLRLQQPCPPRRHRRGAVPRRLSHASSTISPRLHPGGRVTSIFFGGGTPSLMAAGDRRARSSTPSPALDAWSRDAEITLEANPTSVEAERFARLPRRRRQPAVARRAGARRCEPQGPRPQHTVARGACSARAGQAPFRPRLVRPDLRARRPDGARLGSGTQPARLAMPPTTSRSTSSPSRRARRSPRAMRAGTLHMPNGDSGARALSADPGAVRGGGPAGLRDLQPCAAGRGVAPQSRSIGAGSDYAGIGPGAHSRIVTGGAKRALSAIKSPEGWLAEVEARGHGVDSDEALSAEEAADEYLLMALRLSEGLDLTRLAAIDGRVLGEERVRALESQGLIDAQRRPACHHALGPPRAEPANPRTRGLI